MRSTPDTLLLTGATGLLGALAVRRLLATRPDISVVVLVRDSGRWGRLALGADPRVVAVVGDVTRPGLGLHPDARRWLAGEVTAVLHLAADTTFSRPLPEARAVNTEGTRNLLELAAGWPGVRRFAYVSTAFVAGRRTGAIAEGAGEDLGAGWVNGYEQSKAEAERLVRASAGDWVVLRPSTVVCDSADSGLVTQQNAVHRALRLYYGGLASMMPSAEGSALDVVPADYVADAVAELALRPELAGETLHLCAGAGAMPLVALLDETYEQWARAEAWRRRAIPRPALTDLETYRLFERAVEETGDARLRRVTQSLSHFIPQLALPKRFETARADGFLGRAAPPVRAYWGRMVAQLLSRRAPEEAAA
ncbi:MAG TPA: SDR family oxidoreductase [Gemmatimonadaceae bacterium]|nr:SDR family oxidoreductase [Gemmatimonadaceae bacterium]